MKKEKGTSKEDLKRSLESDDPMGRLKALRSLNKLEDEEVVEYLLQALGDPDIRVKVKAIDACGHLRAAETTPVLIQLLFLRGHDAFLERRVLAALGKIGDARAAEPIMEYLAHNLDHATRGTAIFALGDLGAPTSLQMLAEIEETEENPTLRRLAREAGAKVKHHQAIRETEVKQPLQTFLHKEGEQKSAGSR